MDQTSAQNLPNSARVLVYTKDKSKIIKNPRKYRVNTVGFQAINGNSLLKFIDNSKIVSMIQYIADIRIVNMKNQKIKETLYKIVYNSNLDEGIHNISGFNIEVIYTKGHTADSVTYYFKDYMQLPPESDRKIHHQYLFADFHNSYLKYKGIEYCKKL